MATPEQIRRRGRWSLILGVLVAAGILVGMAGAATWTDDDHYAPGSTVTISGDNSNDAGYLAGETVRADVTGPNGWMATCEASADDNGAWSCQVTLSDGEEAVGHYEYTATGLQSGVAENGSFEDGGFFVRAVTSLSPLTLIAVTFPGNAAGTTSTISGFPNGTCTPPRNKFNGVPFETLTTNYRVVPGVNTEPGSSIQIQAPSPVTVGANTYVFSSWTVDQNGTHAGLSTANPACLSLWSSAGPPDNLPTRATANYVLADITAPTVTINSALPDPVIVSLSGSAPNLVVKWQANEAGTYKVVLGTDCAATAVTGTNTSGTYATANTEVTTTIPASSLAFGSNTITVCVTDAGTNTGTDAETRFKKAETGLSYSGDPVAVDPANPTLKATLVDVTNPGCDVRGKSIDFFIDLTGDGDFDDAGESLGTATTATTGTATHNSAQATFGSVNVNPGIYLVYVEFDGTDECAASNDDAIVSVVSPDDATNGGGWYHISGVTSASKRVNFGYTTRWHASSSAYRGQIVVQNKAAWRLKGEITAFLKTGSSYPLSGSLGGNAALYCWNATTEAWVLADSSVSFIASIYDTGPPPKKGSVKPDKFTMKTIAGYTAGGGCPSSVTPLLQNALQELKGGNIHIK